MKAWALVAASVIAGGLAVPLHVVATPLSAAGAGAFAALGLVVWRWSHLRSSMKMGTRHAGWPIVRPAMSMGLGLLVGLGALAVIRLVIEPAIPAAGARIAAAGALPLWRRAAIIYVAAVGEELVFRLLLLSLIAGILVRLVRRTEQGPSRRIIWVANGLSALAFAAVHLPAWSAMGPLSPGLALMVLALNGVGGLVFGYVFVKHGISAAMWAHAGADCAVQLIGPLTG